MSKISLYRLTFYLHKRFFSAKSLHKSTPTTTTTATNVSNTVTELKTDVVKPYPFSSSFTVQYLMNSCGLSLKSAISASKRVQLEEKNKPKYDSVVCFLKSNEFNHTHIVKLVEKQPSVLSCRISANLEPKFKFLTQNGVPGSIVPQLLVSVPNIVFRSVDTQLKPVMELIREYVCCDDKFLVAVVRGSWIFNCDVNNTLRPNVEFLIQQGLPKNRVGDLFVTQPRCLYWMDVERMVSAVNMVKSIGIMPSDPVFIYALRVVLTLSVSSWKRKVGVFESMGWSYDEVISTFVRNPLVLSLSEKKLRSVMDFLVNTVKIDRKIVIGYPKLLAYSLEKRIVPRYTVWKILKERDLIPHAKFVWLLNRSEQVFTDSFITRFSAEVPHLRSIYDQSKKLGRVSV
ncbi:hypothetical protein RND81_09G207600 [Saponaria officinalis]|uniref:Uncharacterized protein n=2 Tax=Saponaria officinalis TaxID=3572 RepID=A0AAW1INK8_SAPOF